MNLWQLTDEEFETLSVRNKRLYNKAHTYISCDWDNGQRNSKEVGFKILLDLGWEYEDGILTKPDFYDVLNLNKDNFVTPLKY